MCPLFKKRTSINPYWLQSIYEKNRERTFSLGKQAIDYLNEQNVQISYRNISETSKRFDLDQKGIHPNSVKSNNSLYEYYLKHRKKSNKKKKLTSDFQERIEAKNYFDLQPDRNLNKVRKKYESFNKQQLIELLIHAEEHIVKQNTMWIKEQFNHYK